MITIERTVDISKPIQTETLRGNEFKLEANAHTFRISVANNGAAVALTGSVSASMLLADGSGLTLGGSLDNGVAVLTLPQAAYGVPGRFMLAIYSVQTGETEAETVKTCIYACVGAVINTYGEQQYDPGNLIPDAETLAAYIEACQNATTAANTAAGRAETAALTAVTYAEQTGKTDAEKTQARTNIGAASDADVSSLKSAIGDYSGQINLSETLWEKGGLYVDGTNWNSNKHIRTKSFLSSTTARIVIDSNYLGYLVGYTASGTCVGMWDQRTGYKTFNQQGQPFTEYVVDFERFPNYKYRVFLASKDTSVTDLPLSAYTAVSVYNTEHELRADVDSLDTKIDSVSSDLVKNVDVNCNDADMWEVGTIDSATGAIVNTVTNVIRTKAFLPSEIAIAKTDFNSVVRVYAYTQAGVYVGSWNPSATAFDTTGGATRYFDFAAYPDYKYKIVLQHETTGSIALTDYAKCTLYNYLQASAQTIKTNVQKLSLANDYNDVSFWAVNGYDITTGSRISWSGKIRTNDFVPDYVSVISTVDSDTNLWLLAYNSLGNYVGTWNWTSCAFDTTGQNCREFDVENISKFYPSYRYKLMMDAPNGTSDYNKCKFANHNSRQVLLKYRKPVLSFIDDDGYAESAQIWENLCDRANIRMDMALVTSQIDSVNYIVTSDTVKRLDNKGIEMISHTHGHINLNTETDPDVVKTDFETAIQALRDLYGTSNFVVYPYTQITSDNAAIVRQYFKAGFGERNAINTYSISKSYIARVTLNDGGTKQDIVVDGQTISAMPFKSLDTIKGLLRKAVMTNGWIIFMTHLRNTYNGDGFYYSSSVGDDIVSACEYAREIGMEILPVSKGYEVFSNVMH